MKLSADQLSQLAQTAQDAALAAADYIQSQVRYTHQRQLKTGTTNLASQVVTAIDRESQKIILALLAESMQRYDLGLLTEELPDDGSRLSKDYFWCIDPLDGTLPFLEQNPGYAVSIALVDRAGQVWIGVVVDPHKNKQYAAIRNQGCTVEERPYRFRPQLSEKLVCHWDLSFIQTNTYPSTRMVMEKLSQDLGNKSLRIQTGPGAVMNALGLLDHDLACYFKLPKAQPGGGCLWDYAATQLIFHELGLFVSDFSGQSLVLNHMHTVYMNHAGILYATDHSLAQEVLARCRGGAE